MAQWGTYRDGGSNTNEKHVDAETDRDQARIVSELMVETICDGTAQAKGQDHSRGPHAQRNPPVGQQQAQIDLQADQEEEEDETQIGGQGEGGDGGGREDCIGEAWDATED